MRQKIRLFNKLEYMNYPKCCFLGFIMGVLLVIIILDIVAYRSFYNTQRNCSKNLLSASLLQFHKDVEHIEHRFLRLSSNSYQKKLLYTDKLQLVLTTYLNNDSKNHLNQNIEGNQNTQTTQDTKSIQSITNIEPLINKTLKFNDANRYKNFLLVFRFNTDNSIGYIQTPHSKYIDTSTNPSSLFDGRNLRKLHSADLFGNNKAVVEIYLKQSALQEFLRWLLQSSIIAFMIALLLAYYLYQKFYGLKKYNLRLAKDKNLFQQQAEITLASIHDGVILTNSTSQIIYINHVVEKFLKLNSAAVNFKSVGEIIPELHLLENIAEQHLKLSDFKLELNSLNYYFDVQAIKLYNEQGGYIGNAICLHDITGKKSAQQRINYLAYNDELTALGNKQALLDYYGKTIREHARFENNCEHKLCTIVINIQSLKNINDTIGYENGEQTLVSLIEILRACLAQENLENNLYRISEDVLAIAFVHDAQKETSNRKCNQSHLSDTSANSANFFHESYTVSLIDKLSYELNKPIVIAQQNIYLQYTFGVSVYPDNFVENFDAWLALLDYAVLLRYAEIAMSAARRQGPGKFVFYSEDINLSIKEKFHLENELRTAVRENELELLFHPQMHVQSDKLRGFEVLVRWRRNDDRVISPGTFIPLLEKSGLIVTVGDWILREACLQGLQLIKNGINLETLSVNISGIQLQTENFIERLKNILLETKFPKEKLELEITESVFFDNPKLIISILHSLREDGIKIALDDFGTGFSSLTYLKNLPLDCLKIDKEFVKEVATGDTRLLEAILAIAKTMNLISVAEGVETVQEVDFLRQHMCDIIQGYYICKPLTVAAVITKFGSDYKL